MRSRGISNAFSSIGTSGSIYAESSVHALLFLHRAVLSQELAGIIDAIRAKQSRQSRQLPTVLIKEEVRSSFPSSQKRSLKILKTRPLLKPRSSAQQVSRSFDQTEAR